MLWVAKIIGRLVSDVHARDLVFKCTHFGVHPNVRWRTKNYPAWRSSGRRLGTYAIGLKLETQQSKTHPEYVCHVVVSSGFKLRLRSVVPLVGGGQKCLQERYGLCSRIGSICRFISLRSQQQSTRAAWWVRCFSSRCQCGFGSNKQAHADVWCDL